MGTFCSASEYKWFSWWGKECFKQPAVIALVLFVIVFRKHKSIKTCRTWISFPSVKAIFNFINNVFQICSFRASPQSNPSSSSKLPNYHLCGMSSIQSLKLERIFSYFQLLLKANMVVPFKLFPFKKKKIVIRKTIKIK